MYKGMRAAAAAEEEGGALIKQFNKQLFMNG
jgi:hypothetical protein